LGAASSWPVCEALEAGGGGEVGWWVSAYWVLLGVGDCATVIRDVILTLYCRYLEQRFGEGTVRRMNGCLRGKDYDEEKLFGECCGGRKVEDLWYVFVPAVSAGKRLTFI